MARFESRSKVAPAPRKRSASSLSRPRSREDIPLQGFLLRIQRTAGNEATNQLVAQLSVQRFKAPKDPAQAAADKATADAQQATDRSTLKSYVDEGAKQKRDRRLANSCEWVLTGRAKLYALTRTGDSPKRVKRAGKSQSTYSAFFPKAMPSDRAGAITDPAVSYNAGDLDDNTHVEIDEKSTVGWNLSGIVAVTKVGSRTKEYVWETLRHEVQHAADRSDDKTSAAGTDKNKVRLESYKTEYRAYNYEGGKYDAFSHANKVTHEGYEWTEKQWEIFKGIRDDYSHTEKGWNSNGDVGGGVTFRQAVVAYANPDTEGFNKYNSVRVDEFYNKLKAVTNTKKLNDAEVKALITALRALKPEDCKYILNESPDMQKLMSSNLASVVRLSIIQQLNQGAAK